MKKRIKLFVFLIILGALTGAMFLVKQKQEIRKGAAGKQVETWFLPTESGELAIGDSFPVSLVADFGTNELNAFRMKITYPTAALDITSDDITFHSAFGENILLTEVDQQEGAIYLSALTIHNGPTGLLSITDPWIRLNFTVKAQVPGSIELVNSVAGYQYFEINGLNTNEEAVNFVLTNNQGGGVIRVDYDFAGQPVLSPTATSVPSEPEATPEANAPVLNFKVILAGVKDSSKVKRTPTATVIISRNSNLVAQFKNVPLQPDEGAVFKGSVVLNGVSPGEGYLIKIRGILHLARRFCSNNQKTRCSGSGEITLVAGENQLDFTGLPLEPGDTLNPDQSMKKDHVINGVDFARVKSLLGKNTEENWSIADFDFNNSLNSRDLVQILNTLATKYGEE